MAVGTLYEHGLSVDEQLGVLDLYLAEAHLHGHRLHVLVVLLHRCHEGVEVWCFRCPLLRVLHVKLKRVLQHRRSSRLALHLRCVDDFS